MPNSSKNLQHKILQSKYHCAKEYDLDGDRVNTDEFIYDSDVSVEDKVPTSRLGKKHFVERVKGEVTGDKVVDQRAIDPKVESVSMKVSRAAPRMGPSDNGFGIPPKSDASLVPDPSVDGRKIEETSEVPIFLDGSPVATSTYEAIFEPTGCSELH